MTSDGGISSGGGRIGGGTGGRSENACGLPGTGGARGGAGGAGGATSGGSGGGGGSAGGRAPVGGQGLPVCGSGVSTDATAGWIFFDSDQANFNRDIYRVRPDGSGLARVTSAPSIEKEPAVSPDGRRMAFASDRAGSMQVFLMDLATSAVTQVTAMPLSADEPKFSHDGQRLAFHSGASVYVTALNGTCPILVASGLDSFNAYSWPDFSADDQELVFDRNNEIDAAHLDGSGFRRVVSNWTTTIKSPSVSPSGRELAYAVFCDSRLSIWTTPFSIETNPCAGRRLTSPSEPLSQHPAWGPGDVFAYERVDKATNIASIVLLSRVPNSAPCILTVETADSRNPSWAP